MIYWQLMDINGWRNVCLLLYGKQFPRKFNGNQCEPRKMQDLKFQAIVYFCS